MKHDLIRLALFPFIVLGFGWGMMRAAFEGGIYGSHIFMQDAIDDENDDTDDFQNTSY